MADNTNISWADKTFNPWIGCTKVSPACDGCYAEALMGQGGRFGRVEWGAPGRGDGTRVRTVPSTWAKVRTWDRQAATKPGPTFVFCASLADVFDNAVPPEWRRDLFDLIRETPHLTYLLLTKRPGMIRRLYDEVSEYRDDPRQNWLWPRNAAIGCTVVNQEEAERDVPKLLAAKAALKPAFAFLSMEPLLGPVDLRNLPFDGLHHNEAHRIDWVITGGETDQGEHKARPADPAWFRSLRDQCAAAGVPFHFKQNGEWIPESELSEPRGPIGLAMPGGKVWRAGKDHDPCTLDGVKHDARPEVAR